MANYRVLYSCGHTIDKQLFGKHDGRERYIAWARTYGECPDCVTKSKLDAINAFEIENNLPELVGSVKQIVWARDIRHEKIKELIQFFTKLEPNIKANFREQFDSRRYSIMLQAANKTSASFWIDTKDAVAEELAQKLIARLFDGSDDVGMTPIAS